MTNTLPQFTPIDPSRVVADLTQLLDDNQKAIAHCLAHSGVFDWDGLMRPLEEWGDRLSQFWALVRHLNAVVGSAAWRSAYNACLPKLSDYETALLHNQNYYTAVQSIANNAQYASLDTAQKTIIQHTLRDFKLAGVALSPQQKKEFAVLSAALSQLSAKFEENVLDATQAWTQWIKDESGLIGLPEYVVQVAAEAAQERGVAGWLLTLDAPSYSVVMRYAQQRTLRQAMYTAFVTRASDQGPDAGRWDNTKVMMGILEKRLALAQLLGFDHYVDRALATKMLSRAEEVFDFLQSLLKASLPQAKREFEELQQFAKSELNLPSVEAWDIAYVSEQLRQARYEISQEALRPYFPEYKVIEGLFAIIKKLFQVTMSPVAEADAWHETVRCYAVYSAAGTLISYFYLDLYAREKKRGGAWMDECRVRRRLADGHSQIPIAFITCNFSAPIGEDPALLTHGEVLTLFHEMGHALQHMLTKIEYAEVSGINGVPWDAVEIASQFLENWAWESESIRMISEHYQTKAPLPAALLEKMRLAKHFQAALHMVRQLEFALFDLKLHWHFDPEQGPQQIQSILDTVRTEVAVTPIPDFNRFQHSFTHIFHGGHDGYAAGYYSYLWSEVMASDAFSLFREQGIFDAASSQKFLKTFLESGGSREPMDLFLEFRGRKPELAAFLQDVGIR